MSRLRKVKRVAVWFILNGGLWALVWFAQVHNVQWCWNLARFAIWLFAIFDVLLYIATRNKPETKEKLKTEHYPIPIPLRALSDVTLAGFLAATSHFGYASLVITQFLFETALDSLLREVHWREKIESH